MKKEIKEYRKKVEKFERVKYKTFGKRKIKMLLRSMDEDDVLQNCGYKKIRHSDGYYM